MSGRMGEQGGLRTGWLAAFGTEGYDGEPPLLEELGVNFGHIKSKVCLERGCYVKLKSPLQINPSSLLFPDTANQNPPIPRPSQSSTPSRASTNT